MRGKTFACGDYEKQGARVGEVRCGCRFEVPAENAPRNSSKRVAGVNSEKERKQLEERRQLSSEEVGMKVKERRGRR